MSGKNSIQVAIKVRPLFKKEKDQQFFWEVVDNSIHLSDSQTEPYYFDHIFDQDVSNQIIFDKMAKQIVHSALRGFNGTIFAYGQTSSGKTYTMMGDDDNPGVMVLAAKEIFKEIERTKDRRFLLRVGYIEIYNEKICDLLNKKNQDLKIHETSTGIVSVNCEEMIIRSQDDLLTYLDKGGKERTVGETNMNERSSRSHAIFRIIIESQKMDHSEDDAVIQSVINLVDLAGSERADQTGARGTRLKEGGHINKSLLFLSNVIKRLSENEDDKYISFRDSKLTRILQASLGGNALTAIICTIKPNAIEETQSTLNFALRAKAIKNKPQVNEIVSDATMMKRLEQEIKMLKTRLEEEQRKNESQLKVRQLEQRIKDEDLKIISCNSLHSLRNREKRRRTWCPSSTNMDSSTASQQSSAVPSFLLSSGIPQPSRLQAPKTSYSNTGMITPRELPSSEKIGWDLNLPPDNFPELDEEFAPAELVNFEMLSPIKSPRSEQLLARTTSITPKLIGCERLKMEKLENDLQEFHSFINRETNEERRECLILKQQIEIATESLTEAQKRVESLAQRNAELEEERVEHLQLKNVIEITSESLTESEKRCAELQVQLSKLINSNNTASEKIAKYEAELAELKKTNERLEMENREAVNLEFEFKRHKNKSKLRENELLEALNDKEKENNKLEKSLTAINAERFQNTKEELLQRSLNEYGKVDEDGKVCIKCEDLQRLLDENKKNTLEFEKLTLEYEQLKLNYIEIENENEKNKLKIVHLEELQENAKAESDQLLLDVEQLREKLAKLQQDYELLGIENSSKHEECMTLNRQIEVVREEMVELEEKFTKLELSWQEQQQTISDIEAQYTTIQTKYEQLQSQYEELEVTKGQSLTDYKSLEKENVDLQTEIEDLKKKVQDAQQRLLENNTKFEEAAKETKTENAEYTPETSKIQQENEQLMKQLLEIQTQFEDLQREYDDLSNQLMDNLQESECLKNENTKLKEKLIDYENKTLEVTNVEAEFNELESQLENVISSDRKTLLKTPSPCHNSSMRSSGVCVVEEEEHFVVDSPQSEELLQKFYELSESLTEIELEHTNGKTKLFKSALKNSTPKSYKMYLKNILGVHQTQKEFDMEIENIHLQGSFKHHSFHIVELSGKDQFIEIESNSINVNGCDNIAEYIEKLKQEIIELKTINESINQDRLNNKSLLESTERALSEMKEQITQLSAELLEKSIFVENCACKIYQQQIENLEREKADITIIYEELQEKVNSTLNGSLLMNNTTPAAETVAVADDKLKELEELKLRAQELLESYDSQTKMLEQITQRCVDMETELENAREELKKQENEFREKHNQLELENLQKLELSANEYRDNMKKYNKEWEERRDEYERTIKDLQNQINDIQPRDTKTVDLEMATKQENTLNNVKIETEVEKQSFETLATDAEQQDAVIPEDIEEIKQHKCRLEEEKLSLLQQLNTAETLVENMKEENRTHYEEITLLDAKIVHLEELLTDAKLLHITISRENSSLKTEIDDIREDLNCIPELHDKNQKLSDEIEKLNQEYSHLKDKLQKSITQELDSKDSNREEPIQTLQPELHNTTLEEEKQSLANDFENLKQQYKQVHDKLQKAEQQVLEFCSEDLSREELIQTLQSKLGNMTAVENEKKSLEIEIMRSKESLNSLQEKELKTSEEIQNLKEKVGILLANVAELETAADTLKLEKSELEEKLRQITSDYDLLQTDKIALETQLNNLTEERNLMHEQCSLLQEEKRSLEEQLKSLKEKEKIEELLQETIKEKSELVHSLRCINEKLETAQNQLKENEKAMSHTREETLQIQQVIKSLKGTIEEQHNLLEETERENEKIKQDNTKLYQDLQTLRQDFNKAIEENQEKHLKMKELQQDNSQLNIDLTKLVQENHEQQSALANAKQEHNNLQQEFSSLQNNYQKSQQQNQELEQQLKDLHDNLVNIKEGQNEKLETNTRLQTELQATKESLTKLQEEQQNLQEKLERYKKYQEENHEQQLALAKAKTELNNLQQELSSLQNNYQKSQQQNQELEQQLKDLHDNLVNIKEGQNEKLETNTRLQTELQATEESLTKLQEENQNLQEKLERYKKYQEENHEQQLALAKAKTELNNLQQDLITLKESLSQAVEQKQQEVNSLANKYQISQQQNQELQQQLKDLNANLLNIKEGQNEKLETNTRLQTELQATEESLTKLKEENQNLQEKLTHYQKLQEDKNKLEATINVLKKAQSGALSSLQEEKDQLLKTIQQYDEENKEFKEKEETLQQKLASLCQQMHEMRSKAYLYEKVLIEHEEVESLLTSIKAENKKLQDEISQLTSQQETYISKMENLSSEIEKLNVQLENQTEEKQVLQTKLSQLKETLQGEQFSFEKKHHDVKSSLEELKLKYDSLLLSNTQLENINKQLEEQLKSAKQKLKEFHSVQEELKTVKVQHSELQQSLKEAGRFSLTLHEDVERHKQLFQKQLENYNSLKVEMETKVHSLSEENLKLSASIEALKKEQLSLEGKLREITVRNFEQDLQRQATDATSNTSMDSNVSHSPRGRRSFERMSIDKVSNTSLEEKLSAIQQKNTKTAERKNRRISTHDERRRQSYWGAAHDKATMTDSIDTSCNCIELDRKLKDCERNLFIKSSQVTTLNMELKNHPLKEENANLKKRLQEEQDKHRIEIKRCKNKLSEQTAKAERAIAAAAHAKAKSAHAVVNAELAAEQQVTPVLPKIVADVEIQTDDELSACIQKLQGKYNDLKNICRHRYNAIKELEEKVAQKENSNGNSQSVLEASQFKFLNNQCESLKKELKTLMEKYENAKKVLYSRREEIVKLRAQLEQTQ